MPRPSVLFPLLLLSALLLQAREHTGAGIFDQDIAEILWNYTARQDVTVFQWRNPFLYPLSAFNVTYYTTPCIDGQPPPTEVTHVVCGEVWIEHWPHFAEVLFPCWSFFQREPTAVRLLLRLPHVRRNVERLSRRLQLLNVTYIVEVPDIRCARFQVVLRRHYRDGFRGTEGPLGFLRREDAASLQRALLATSPRPLRRDPGGRLRVGLLNRRGSRQLLHTDELRRWLAAQAADSAIDEVPDIDALPFPEQCRWVHRQHIIIAPHGAQLTNLICGAPCASLLELFPRNYFLPGFFQPLATLLGMSAFGLYPQRDPYGDSERCMKSYWCRTWAQAGKVPLPRAARPLLPLLLRAHRRCCAARPGGCPSFLP